MVGFAFNQKEALDRLESALETVDSSVRNLCDSSNLLSKKMIRLNGAMIALTIIIAILTGIMVCDVFSFLPNANVSNGTTISINIFPLQPEIYEKNTIYLSILPIPLSFEE